MLQSSRPFFSFVDVQRDITTLESFMAEVCVYTIVHSVCTCVCEYWLSIIDVCVEVPEQLLLT